jgi:hypothetical protein
MKNSELSFEQIFSGHMLLVRARRHICQAWLIGFDHFIPAFRAPEGDEAFRIIERKLIELETEFDAKKKACDRAKRLRLDRRADRQVTREG